jgi:hypothetical protein
MRKLRMIGPCLLVAAVVGLIGASQASAALPEFGRCLKVEGVKEGNRTHHHGRYKNRTCLTESAGGNSGRYEWFPGPGAETAEKEYENPGSLEPATLTTTNGTTIACKNHKAFGELTGEKTETSEIILFECENTALHVPCQTLLVEGKPQEELGKIIFEPMEGTLGYVSQTGKKPVVGWDLKPKLGSLISLFECGTTKGLGTKVILEGSVILQVKTTDVPKEEFKAAFVASGAQQEPEMLEGGAKDTLSADFLVGLENKTEAVSLSSKEVISTFEPTEYRAK